MVFGQNFPQKVLFLKILAKFVKYGPNSFFLRLASFCPILTLIPYFFQDFLELFKNVKILVFLWFRMQISALNLQRKTQNKPKSIFLILGCLQTHDFNFFNRFRKYN